MSMREAISLHLSIDGEMLRDETMPEIYQEYISATIDPLAIRNTGSLRGPLVLSVVRNEIHILEDFLNHYRKAGIERFALLDNRSTDGTIEFLAKQPDVDLYRANAPFTTIRKQAWINLLLDIYQADNQWFVYADADEHIVFDGMEYGRNLADMACAMDRAGVRRVRGCLVDMYSERPLAHATIKRGQTLIEAYPFFDGTGYKEYALPPLIAREGGPRQRLFASSSDAFRPQLSKYPLFRLDPGDIFINPHFLWPYDKNFVSDCFLGILHFKFLPNFRAKVERAVEEKNYWKNSLEYQHYESSIADIDLISFVDESTKRYQEPQSLVDCGLIVYVPWS